MKIYRLGNTPDLALESIEIARTGNLLRSLHSGHLSEVDRGHQLRRRRCNVSSDTGFRFDLGRVRELRQRDAQLRLDTQPTFITMTISISMSMSGRLRRANRATNRRVIAYG